MEDFIVKMGRFKAKQAETPAKAAAKTLPEKEAIPYKNPSSTPPSPLDQENVISQDTSTLDYKILAIEVARLIAPDIQTTLASTVAGILRKLKDAVSQHGNRLDLIEYDMETTSSEHSANTKNVEKLIRDNSLFRDRLEDLENRSTYYRNL
ncbi:hypothetical protein GDO78_019072 [Eleutherodactylus coqui]|uniref:Uncharacterized protein n=1 Tax=Eleutherodactylus coqui TaxID=57060 RepID=A0A8J6K260_ELECQ|nr:hypothetical protein GDO78_019072 [Eleutherodactylus coqui]